MRVISAAVVVVIITAMTSMTITFPTPSGS